MLKNASPIQAVYLVRGAVWSRLLVEPHKPEKPDRRDEPERPHEPAPRHAPRNVGLEDPTPLLTFSTVSPDTYFRYHYHQPFRASSRLSMRSSGRPHLPVAGGACSMLVSTSHPRRGTDVRERVTGEFRLAVDYFNGVEIRKDRRQKVTV